MQDMIAIGETWFRSQRREHLATEVSYQPTVGLTRTVRATVVVGQWESVDSSGQILRTETRDFLVDTTDLAQDPKKGDRIVYGDVTYEVMVPPGAQHHWRWSDRNETLRRIHTMVVSGAAASANDTLLVRAVGASTAAAITDEQIVAQLTLDLGTGRSISQQVTAAAAYLYIVLPDSFGTPMVSVNGFRVTAFQATSRSITFSGQTARAYTIYRSTYPVTGSVLVEVA
jgi:hypothetical protein